MKIVIPKSKARRFVDFCSENDMIEIIGTVVNDLTVVHEVDMPSFISLPPYAAEVKNA